MSFLWNEPKPQACLKNHGLFFVNAQHVFAGPLRKFEGERNHDGEIALDHAWAVKHEGSGDYAS